MSETIGFIGCGNMGRALLDGWLSTSALGPESVYISARTTAASTAGQFGVQNCTLETLIERSEIVILGMKPQQVEAAVKGLEFRTEQCVISLLAGVTISHLEELVAPAGVVRTMPNLACGVGAGVTLLMAGSVSPVMAQRVEALFAELGHVEVFEEETLFHAGTGISGSGPAYLFLAAAGLADGGVQAGLTYDVALRLACETIVGAGALLKTSGRDPDALRVAVTSPGGTTQAALGELGRHSFREGLVAAVIAAAERSEVLSRR